MIDIAKHGTKILASHFAAVMKTGQESGELESFVYHNQDEYQLLKQWWDDMQALQVIRAAENCIRNLTPEAELSSENRLRNLPQVKKGLSN